MKANDTLLAKNAHERPLCGARGCTGEGAHGLSEVAAAGRVAG